MQRLQMDLALLWRIHWTDQPLEDDVSKKNINRNENQYDQTKTKMDTILYQKY